MSTTPTTQLDLLILGGTRFIGPHIIRTARERGHSVTIFNRGETNPGLFPDVEALRGDRAEGDLRALQDGEWDAVVDSSAYFPRVVRDVLEILGRRIDHYLLISTISVYDSWDYDRIDEETPLHTALYDDTEELTSDTYGPLKAACEEQADEFDGSLTVMRPGIVAGPRDHTDRFTYWPVRTSRGGEMAAPGSPRDSLQYIDVRDLAAWILDCLEERITGTFNTVVPPGSVTMGSLLDGCRSAVDQPAELSWLDADFLREHDAHETFPIWVPQNGELRGLANVNTDRALAAGMQVRPVVDTAADTLAWHQTLSAERQQELRAGPSPELEQELLSRWDTR